MTSARAALIAGISVAAASSAVIGFLVSRYQDRLQATEQSLADTQTRRDSLAEEVVQLEMALEQAQQDLQAAQAMPVHTPIHVTTAHTASSGPKTETLNAGLLKQLDALRKELAEARAKQDRGAKPSAARNAALDLVQEGDRHFAGGNLRKARIAYLQALEQDPDLADPHLRLGMISEYLGHDAAAVSSYEEYVRLRPESKYSRTTAVKMGTLFEETASSAEIFEMEADKNTVDPSDPVVIPAQ